MKTFYQNFVETLKNLASLANFFVLYECVKQVPLLDECPHFKEKNTHRGGNNNSLSKKWKVRNFQINKGISKPISSHKPILK